MTEQPPKRRRGGQPGNLNALKHGFYSRQFRQIEMDDLEGLPDKGIDSEINVLRVVTRRILELTNDNQDVETGIRLLTVMGMTATRLSNILRTQALLHGDRQDELYAAITQALEAVNKELCKA